VGGLVTWWLGGWVAGSLGNVGLGVGMFLRQNLCFPSILFHTPPLNIALAATPMFFLPGSRDITLWSVPHIGDS
jgi:hypothetical protein